MWNSKGFTILEQPRRTRTVLADASKTNAINIGSGVALESDGKVILLAGSGTAGDGSSNPILGVVVGIIQDVITEGKDQFPRILLPAKAGKLEILDDPNQVLRLPVDDTSIALAVQSLVGNLIDVKVSDATTDPTTIAHLQIASTTTSTLQLRVVDIYTDPVTSKAYVDVTPNKSQYRPGRIGV
jgi:hypothetical protein